MKKVKAKFDERQILIRGKVFFHGFITVITLLLVNAFLQDNGVVWASGFHQSVLIMMFGSTFVAVEAILRGAYFENENSRRVINGVFGLLSITLSILCVQRIVKGAALVENGVLSGDGFSLVLAVLFITTTVTGISKALADRRGS